MVNSDFDSEQRDMLLERDKWYRKIKERKEKLKLKRGGTKFLGDVGVQVLAHHLERHLETRLPNLKVVRGPAFIVDFEEREFDMLIVDKAATASEFTNAYPKSKAHIIVEVKSVGLICKKSDIKRRMKRDIIAVSVSLNLPALYFSFIEAKSYREEIRKTLDEKDAFILAESKGKKEPKPYENEWKRFVDRVCDLICRKVPFSEARFLFL